MIGQSATGYGVEGIATGAGTGIYGSSASATGVYGTGSTGVRAVGTTTGLNSAASAGISGFLKTSNATGTNTSPTLVTQAAASQTANLFEWQNSSGTALGAVTSSGDVGIGTASPSEKTSCFWR